MSLEYDLLHHHGSYTDIIKRTLLYQIEKTSQTLNIGGTANLTLLRKLLAISQKLQQPNLKWDRHHVLLAFKQVW